MDCCLYFFFIWAAIKERRSLFLGLLGAVIVLTWITFCGFFALGIYHIPLFSFSRYLYSGFFLLQPLVILGAGFGWENFWVSTRRAPIIIFILLGFVFFVDAINFSYARIPSPQNLAALQTLFIGATPLGRFSAYLILVALILISTFLINRLKIFIISPAKKTWIIQIVLICVLLFDILSYFYNQDQIRGGTLASILDFDRFLHQYTEDMYVNRMNYQPNRLDAPEQNWQIDALLRSGSYQTIYNYAQFDPCVNEYKALNVGSGVYQFLLARVDGDFLKVRTDRIAKEILGCTTPKLRLMPRAINVKTIREGINLIQNSPDVSQKVVILSEAWSSKPLQDESIQDNYNAADEGIINVTKFSANHLELTAEVSRKPGMWLIYADGFHPDWHAYINGQETPIEKAYLGFKAVWVPYGSNVVRFEYNNGLIFSLYTFLAISGAIFCILLFIWLLWPGGLRSLPSDLIIFT